MQRKRTRRSRRDAGLKQYSVVFSVAFGYSSVILMLILLNYVHVMGGYLMNLYPNVTLDDVLDILCPANNLAETHHMSSFVSDDLSVGVPDICFWHFTGGKPGDGTDLLEFLYIDSYLGSWTSIHATQVWVLFVVMIALVSHILPEPVIHWKFFNLLWSSNFYVSLCTSCIVLLLLSINGLPNGYNK
jgi:hypothetical protein